MLAQAALIVTITALAGLLLAAARSDVASFTIPNELCLAVLALAPVFWWSYSTLVPVPFGVWAVLATGFVIFAFGFLLFALGVMGGGDVKLMAALGFWMGPTQAAHIFTIIVLTGGVLALVVALQGYFERRKVIAQGTAEGAEAPLGKRPIPYGVAIAVGGWVYVGQLILNAFAP